MEFTPYRSDRLFLVKELSPRCEVLSKPSMHGVFLSILILIGIAISYGLQIHKILKNKHCTGFSPLFPLLGFISGTYALANILSLPNTLEDASCCTEISPGACFAGLLGVIQVGAQWLSFGIFTALYVIYPPLPKPIQLTDELSEDESENGELKVDVPAPLVGLYGSANLISTTLITIILYAFYRENIKVWADALGMIAAVIACVQYLPQISYTLRNQVVGSLSIPMMLMQTPGGFLWGWTLQQRLGSGGWSIWGLMYTTATLQGTLLILAIYFHFRNPQDKANLIEPEDRDTESQIIVEHIEDVDDMPIRSPVIMSEMWTEYKGQVLPTVLFFGLFLSLVYVVALSGKQMIQA